MLEPTVFDSILPFDSDTSATIVTPTGGSGSPVGLSFQVAGSCSRDVTKVVLKVYDSNNVVIYGPVDVTPMMGMPYWPKSVTLATAPSNPCSIEATPYAGATAGTAVTKGNIYISSSMIAFAEKAAKHGHKKAAAAGGGPGVGDNSYVYFQYEYPAPSDASQPLYEVIGSMRIYFNADGSLGNETFPFVHTINPPRRRVLRVPYHGPGVYWARFTRIEAFGPIVDSGPLSSPQS